MVSKSILNSELLETEMASKFKNSSKSKFNSPLAKFPADQKLVSVTIIRKLKRNDDARNFIWKGWSVIRFGK